MLVLKRKIGESIIIGDDIELVVLEQDGDGIRLGINAPRHVTVFRKEIYEEIKQANKNALHPVTFGDLVKEYQETKKNDEK